MGVPRHGRGFTVPFRHALSQTLAARRPVILYGIAAITWGGAIAATADDVRGDFTRLLSTAALAATVIAFQYAAFLRHRHDSEEARRATEALTRAILSRPHDRDHEVTGPYATVSGLRALASQRGRR